MIENAKMTSIIDVHCHVTPFDFPKCPDISAAPVWPCMKCQAANAGEMYIGEKPFRKLDDRSWSAARRVEDMDEDNVSIQVLSSMPELFSYWMSVDAATHVCKHVNGKIADMVSQSPSRFKGLGIVPLQAPDIAAEMMADLQRGHGFLGVEIGSNINGDLLGHAKFDPFWRAAEELGMAVFVHALHPVATKSLRVTPLYTALAGFPVDVGMSAASIIMSGVMERFPRLRLAFSHGGGVFASMLGRLDTGWKLTSGFGEAKIAKPSETAKRFFYDSNVYDPVLLKHLMSEMAPKNVFLGTDYPYVIQQHKPEQYLKSADLTRAQEESVMSAAARRFLQI